MAIKLFGSIKADHARIKTILKGMVESSPGQEATRNDLLEQLKDEVLPHLEGEEKTLFAELTRGALEETGSREKALTGIEEHHTIRAMAGELEETPPDSERWGAKARVLMELVLRHVEREENELFNLALKTIDQPQLESMHNKFEKVKEEMMTTV